MQFEDLTDYLPPVVQQIVEVIGFAQTEKLIKKLGGTTFYFSQGRRYFPILKEMLGLESAVALRNLFRSEPVYIPRCAIALRMLRNIRFKQEYNELTKGDTPMGANQAMLRLCPKFGISDRQGWAIVQQLQQPDMVQAALF